MSEIEFASGSPRLTLLIRTIDRPHYLERLLRSVERQEDRNFNVVMVNNGGPDSTQEMLHSWHERLISPSIIFRYEENVPGFLPEWFSSGDYFLSPGDDDLLLPSAVRDIRSSISNYPDAVVLGFSSVVIAPLGWRLPDRFSPPIGFGTNRSALIGRLLADYGIIFPSTAFKTSAIVDHLERTTNYDYCNDWYLALVALAKGEGQLFPAPVLKSRMHFQQHSRQSNDARLGQLIRCQQEAMLIDFVCSEVFNNFLTISSLQGLVDLQNAFVTHIKTRPSTKRDFHVFSKLAEAIGDVQGIGHQLQTPRLSPPELQYSVSGGGQTVALNRMEIGRRGFIERLVASLVLTFMTLPKLLPARWRRTIRAALVASRTITQ